MNAFLYHRNKYLASTKACSGNVSFDIQAAHKRFKDFWESIDADARSPYYEDLIHLALTIVQE